MLSKQSAARLGATMLAGAVAASPAAVAAESAAQAARPTVAAVRIDVSEAPVIDADLSDPSWAKAAVLEDFLQRLPIPRGVPTERTVLRIMYDAENIYFGVYCYDSEPDLVTVRTMARDGAVFTGDFILLLLDPGQTRRNAYTFQIGPSGGRLDALRLNNAEELGQWDAIWSVRTRRVADGWVAEVAIPFRSISYVEGQTDWGFDFGRNIRRKNEAIRWASLNPALPFTDVSESGTLTGISGINQGLGLDVQPYLRLGAKHDWNVPGDGAGITGTAGGNAFYKITPALTGTLTLNTDFSDAPLDARQVNTTRFSLFIPESRDFFLQDAGAFEFGGRGFARGLADRTANNGRPFFSRNIGLADGLPVSIIAGGKLSGEYQGFEIGGLMAYTGATADAGNQLLSVLRLTRPVLNGSKLGFIVTNGDPAGTSDNTVAGVDFQYRTSNFLGGNTLTSDFYYERSFSSTEGHDDSFAVALNFPNQPWGGDFAFKQVGEHFAPELGFINRNGIRLYDGSIINLTRYRDSYLFELMVSGRVQAVTSLDNNVETRESTAALELESRNNDILNFRAVNHFENIPALFDLPGGVAVPAGDYEWTTVGGFIQTSQGRFIAVRAEGNCCSFYDGDGVEGVFQVNLRPNQYFEAVASYRPTFLDLPGGSTDIHLISLEGTLNFTPDMQLAAQVQYDNISQSFGSLLRYRWEYAPGSELFVALAQSALIPGSHFSARRTQFTVRLSRTFRF